MTAPTPLQRFVLTIVASMAIVTTAVYAWGAPGHTKVGAIADELLKDHPRAAAQVRAILGNVTLAQAGPWGDCVRSVTGPEKGFKYEPEEQYRPPCLVFEGGARQDSMESYVRTNWNNWDACRNDGDDGCHSQYHFVNMALQRSGYRFGDVGTREYDIVHAMNAAIAVLRTPNCSGPNPSPTAEVPAPGRFHFTCSQALMMLTHLIGDLHQPLHVGSVYLDEQGRRIDPDSSPAERARAIQTKVTFTYGGNSLTWPNPSPKGRPLKLHSVWDGAPSMTTANAVAAARQVPPTAGPPSAWITQWANDSLVQSRQAFTGVTFAPKQGRTWRVNFAKQSTYNTRQRSLQRQQVAKGGARLAQLLVAIWPDQ